MDIEKDLTVAAPAERVWQMLLDPNVMGACVPGMKSIDVISDMEYVSLIHVKIAFISAKFKIKTTIVEQRAPHYLRTEGTGEDASVASSLKQSSEIFLTERDDGQTELRMKIHVDVLGRLGTFGLSVMKTKADRMWEEFAQNLAARLNPEAQAQTAPAAISGAPPAAAPIAVSAAEPAVSVSAPAIASNSWWSRVLRRLPQPTLTAPPAWPHIRIDIKRADLRRGNTSITVYWPLEASAECRAWLQDCAS